MTIKEFADLLASGASEKEIKHKFDMSNRTYATMVSKAKRRAERLAAGQNGHHETVSIPVESPVYHIALADRDPEGAYWAGVFDALGQLDVRTKDTISVTARFATRQRMLCDAFMARYGGTLREGEGMYAMILVSTEPGLHKLISDLADSKLYADKAGKLAQWLEYRFYLAEQERLLVEAFAEK